jgi:hypothetical protein
VPGAAVADWTLERLGRGETRVDPREFPFEGADVPPPVHGIVSNLATWARVRAGEVRGGAGAEAPPGPSQRGVSHR